MNGGNPVAVVFAREMTPALTGLVKKLDDAAAENKAAKMGAVVVMLASDKDKVEPELKKLAEKENLQKVSLTIDAPEGPGPYKIAKDADVTVILYVNKTVKKNFAYGKGEFTESKAEEILKELPSILEKK